MSFVILEQKSTMFLRCGGFNGYSMKTLTFLFICKHGSDSFHLFNHKKKKCFIQQEEALKKFHITDDPNNYYLARAVDEGQML